MALITLLDAHLAFGDRPLLDGAQFSVESGERLGLIGRNGTGKSTLFNVITGEMGAETGSIEFPPRWRIGRLAQEAPNLSLIHI